MVNKDSRIDGSELGLIHLYTGNGKGKTTASIGLGVRAAGQGLKVCMIEFLKGRKDLGEIKIKDRIPNFEIFQFGRENFVFKDKIKREDLEIARRGFDFAKKTIMGGDFDLVILDEVTLAVYFGLIELSSLIELLKSKPKHVEVVLTGRYADPALVEIADLVTEMREIKHPYRKGIGARRGIEY
ncbi:MAG: cob(I)yrinic acid a,c-diamide adenosyltransferase [Candidatus Asgardarchaeia archaeon]